MTSCEIMHKLETGPPVVLQDGPLAGEVLIDLGMSQIICWDRWDGFIRHIYRQADDDRTIAYHVSSENTRISEMVQ